MPGPGERGRAGGEAWGCERARVAAGPAWETAREARGTDGMVRDDSGGQFVSGGNDQAGRACARAEVAAGGGMR